MDFSVSALEDRGRVMNFTVCNFMSVISKMQIVHNFRLQYPVLPK